MGTNPSCRNSWSGCRVRAYKHGNFSGPNHGVAQTANTEHSDNTLCMKDCNGCIHWQGITSYKVDGCPANVVPVGHYRENAYKYPMGNGGPLGHSLALSGHQGGLPSGWNDNLWGFSFHTTPSANANQISYDLPTRGINAGGSGEMALPKRGISADRDDVILGTGKSSSRAARPCPGGTGSFLQGATAVRCLYSKTDENGLKNLYSNKNGLSADPRASMHANLKDQFCRISANIFKNPGGGSCLEQGEGKRLAKEYCLVGDRIATDGNCTKDNLGNFYAEVAEAYCKGAGKSKDWCSCYNVTNKVCDTEPSAAGCSAKRQNYDRLVDNTPQDYKNSWSGMEACFGGVCAGNKYLPDGYDTNCSKSVNICDFNFDFQSMADSAINASCNITGGGDGGGGGSPPIPSYPPGSISEKLDTNFRSKLPESLQQFIPVSTDELSTDSNKLLGVGGTGFSSIICVILIIVILVAGAGGGKRGRFRR